MNNDERRLTEKLGHLADEGVGAGSLPAVEARREIRRRQRVRAFAGGGVAVVLMAGVAWGSVLVSNGDSPKRVAPAQDGPAIPCDEDSPTDALECATPTPGPVESPAGANPVLVFQLREGQSAYTKGSYAPSPRMAGGDHSTQGRLRAALQELVKGPTPPEQAAGFESIFSSKTADILRSVRVTDDGRAIVDFADFRDELPNAAAAEGGTVFIFELNHTVFQFPDVQSVEYRIEEDCGAFWEFLQGACDVVTRADFENAP